MIDEGDTPDLLCCFNQPGADLILTGIGRITYKIDGIDPLRRLSRIFLGVQISDIDLFGPCRQYRFFIALTVNPSAGALYSGS